MSVKILSREDLKRSGSKRRRGSKSSRVAASAVKVLDAGDLVRFCRPYSRYGDGLNEGDVGMILTSSGSVYEVLTEIGIVKLHYQCIERVQSFTSVERKVRLGNDVHAKKL